MSGYRQVELVEQEPGVNRSLSSVATCPQGKLP